MAREGDLKAIILDALQSVAPEADVGAVDPAKPFRDQIDIDSIDFLNFILALEKRAGIAIAAEEYPAMASLNGCLARLETGGPTTIPAAGT